MRSQSHKVWTRTWVAGIISILTSQAAEHPPVPPSPAEPIVLHGITFDARAGLVTLRWLSQAGKDYTIEETTDPELGWKQHATGIPADSPETVWTAPPLPAHKGARSVLFRVRELGRPDEIEAAGVSAHHTKRNDRSGTPLNLPPKNFASGSKPCAPTQSASEQQVEPSPATPGEAPESATLEAAPGFVIANASLLQLLSGG